MFFKEYVRSAALSFIIRMRDDYLGEEKRPLVDDLAELSKDLDTRTPGVRNPYAV